MHRTNVSGLALSDTPKDFNERVRRLLADKETPEAERARRLAERPARGQPKKRF